MHRKKFWTVSGFWMYLHIIMPYCANGFVSRTCEYYSVYTLLLNAKKDAGAIYIYTRI